MEYLSSIVVFHTVILIALKKGQKQEMWLRFYIVENGVSFIDSIPHCHTENAFKRGKIKKCGFVAI